MITTSAPIPDTNTNLMPTNLVQQFPETATLFINFAGELAQETVIYAGQAAGTNNPATFQLTGSGGPKGKYRIEVRATFAGGTLILNGPAGFSQTFKQNETVDCPLAAGTYSWSWTGSPTGCLLKIGAL